MFSGSNLEKMSCSIKNWHGPLEVLKTSSFFNLNSYCRERRKDKERIKIKIDKEKGRKVFHVRLISWSYRIRGNTPRTQMKIYLNIKVKNERKIGLVLGKKIILVRSLINKIFIYSAIKIRAKVPLLYSVLNPDTSSDSPSAKSNGARFVSANAVTNQISSLGAKSKTSGIRSIFVIIDKFKDIIKMIGAKRIKIILTS